MTRVDQRNTPSPPLASPGLGDLVRIVSIVLALSGGATPAIAQDAAKVDGPSFGRRIRLTLPIRGSTDRVVKQMVQRVLEEQPVAGNRPVIVIEFWAAGGGDGGGSEFERALSLARFLTSPELERVRTVAYIPRAAIGHAVLVALACEEIIMARDAVLGDAGAGESSIGPTMRGGYTEIARSRRTVPEAIALGMLDPQLVISQVITTTGVLYGWPEEVERIRNERADVKEINTFIPAGKMGRFRGEDLRKLGIVSYQAENDEELAAALQLPADQLEFDPSMGQEWRAISVEISGPINTSVADRVIKTIDRELESRMANFVCIRLDSPGGSPADSVRIAGFLADLDPSRVRSVAYIPSEARADAMIVALACDQIVAHANAVLGGPGAVTIKNQKAEDLQSAIRSIAQRKARPWSIPTAMIDPNLVVYRYARAGTDEAIYLSPEEFADRYGASDDAAGPDDKAAADSGRWVRGAALTNDGEVLQLDGQRAEQVGIVRFVVDEFADFVQLYQLDDDPELIGPNWAFELIDALASPELAGILLFVGAFALIAELSSPGLGLGGFLSALCFLLYFWANFLHGTAELLEILLFIAGITCIVIEIFVIPGFGVFGLGGGALVLLSLVLAVQTFVLPTNEYQYNQFFRSLTMVAAAGAGVFLGMVLLRKYLAQTPVLGRIMLTPPGEDERAELSQREALVHYDHLLGRVGMARTQLTPSGKAIFDDELVDVISEGQLIPKGSALRVVDVSGNRVLVEPLDLD